MGEIPSWLIELAESSNDDEGEEEEPQVIETFQEPATHAESGFLEEPVTLMDELRSQVEIEPSSEPEPPELITDTPIQPQFVFAGMVPWQLAVLSVFLFLDIAVIGLMFLVILGRISIL